MLAEKRLKNIIDNRSNNYRSIIYLIITLAVIVPTNVFAVSHRSTWAMEGYWWLDDDRSVHDSEDNTGYGTDNVPENTDIAGVERNSPLALRIDISEISNSDQKTALLPSLEFIEGQANCTDTGWKKITPSKNNAWAMDVANSSSSDNSDVSEDRIRTNSRVFSTDPGGSINRATNPGRSTTLDSSSSEWEWIIYATDVAKDNQTYTFRVTNNSTPLDSYNVPNCPRAVTASAAEPSFSQTDYRWYVDNSAADPTDPWSELSTVDLPENTAIAYPPNQNDPPGPEQQIRLRVNLTVNNADLDAGSAYFKLQYKKETDGSCTTGAWTDIGSDNEWEYTSSPAVPDQSSIIELLTVTSSGKGDKYIKSHPAVNGVSAVIGDLIEYDFHLVGTNSASTTQYSFRMVQTSDDAADEIVLDSYSNCPTLTTQPQATDFLRHGKILNERGQGAGMFWADK